VIIGVEPYIAKENCEVKKLLLWIEFSRETEN
jgi:hypothetical protein